MENSVARNTSAFPRSNYQLEQDRIQEEIIQFLSYELSDKVDKRRMPRVPVSIPATYYLYQGEQWDKVGKNFLALNLSNIGMKGLSGEQLVPNSYLFVRFSIGKETPIQILGKVAWGTRFQNQWLSGIDFTNSEPRYRGMIDEFVNAERGRWFATMARKTGKDRRKFFRIPRENTVEFTIYEPGASQRWEKQVDRLTLVDLSATGMGVRCRRRFSIGTLIAFSLPIQDEQVSLIGEVLWTKLDRYGNTTYGLRFLNLEESHRDAIIRYVLQEEQKLIRAGRRTLEIE